MNKLFVAAGSVLVLNTAPPTRARIFSQAVNVPDAYILLEFLGLGSQQGSIMDAVEVFFNGSLIHSETTLIGTNTNMLALPLYPIEGYGQLEVFVTNSSGVDTSVTAMIVGRYVPKS